MVRAWATSGPTVIDRLCGCRSRSGALVRVQTPRIDGVNGVRRAVAALAAPVGCRSDAVRSWRKTWARIYGFLTSLCFSVLLNSSAEPLKSFGRCSLVCLTAR